MEFANLFTAQVTRLRALFSALFSPGFSPSLSLGKSLILPLGLLCASGLAVQAQAAFVVLDDFNHVGSDAVDYIIKIEDDAEAGVTAGNFRITYQVAAGSPNTTAKLTGLFLDLGDPFDTNPGAWTAGNLGFSNESTGSASCGQGFNTDSVSAGGGCNTQLQLPATAGSFQNHQFDLAVAWKTNDISDGSPRSFEIADLGFAVSDISAVGVRGQATGLGGNGSAKEFLAVETNPVPLPGAVWLFASGLAFTGFARKLR